MKNTTAQIVFACSKSAKSMSSLDYIPKLIKKDKTEGTKPTMAVDIYFSFKK